MTDRPDDPTQLDWSPLTRGDLDELSGLLTAIEHLDEPDERHSTAELYEIFDEVGSDHGRETLVGRSGPSMVAYAWNHPQRYDVSPRRVYCTGGVHPGWRRHGVGHALLRWQLAASRAWCEATRQPGHGPLQALCVVDEKVSDQRRLYESVGLQAQRWLADMTRRLDGPPPRPLAVPGVRLVPLAPEWFEPTLLAHNAAFADRQGVQPIDADSWREQLTRSACRPHWSWLAVTEDGAEVVGYALSSAYEQDWPAQGFSQGWTDRLGVRPPWRGRGVASALLYRSMQSFHAAGLDAAGLGVDADDEKGAVRLYQHLGYRPVSMFVTYVHDEAG